jgi:hypothetical protein
LLYVVGIIGFGAFAVTYLDLVDDRCLDYGHLADGVVWTRTGKSTVPELVYEAQLR